MNEQNSKRTWNHLKWLSKTKSPKVGSAGSEAPVQPIQPTSLSLVTSRPQAEERSRSPFRRWLKDGIPSTSSAIPPTSPPVVSTPSVVATVTSIPSVSAVHVASTLPAVAVVAPTSQQLTQAGPAITVTACQDHSPWELSLEIARQKLCEHGLPPLCDSPLAGQAGQLAIEIVQLTIEDLHATINSSNLNGKDTIAIGRLREILKTFDKYAKIVDTAVQHSPKITALVWAGVRATLQIALNCIEVTESLEVAIAIIAEKMAACEFFASVYEETRKSRITISPASATHLQQTLDSALPEFYAAILVFSVKARQYFDPSMATMTKLKYMLKPFVIEFKPFIDEIFEKEARVRDCADLATMDIIMRNSGKLAQLHSVLTNVQSKLVPLAKLDDIMNLIARAADKRVQKLLLLLSPLESPKRHQDVQSSRLDGTGAWVLKHERYLSWRDSSMQDGSSHILCCYGNPGAGKTVISSIVIDDLMSQFPHRDYIGIAFIYCDYRDQAIQTLVNILGSILQQLLSAASNVPDTVREQLESIKRARRKVAVKDILEMLKNTLAGFTYVFVCIDAVDELEPQTRCDLLASLQGEFKATGVFLTGRPHIQQEVNGTLKTQQDDTIDIRPDLDDIRAYLQHSIMRDKRIRPDAMDDKLEEEIVTTVTMGSKGMFLLPALHIRMVLEKRTISKRRKALQILPESLNDVFACMVDRILKSPSHEDLGRRTLLLLHLAYRPLKLAELQHALAVEMGDTELDEENIPSRNTLLDCCLGLVIVDEETMTVRFVHYTLEEHFKEHSSTYFPGGYRTVAEICLTYLNYDELRCYCATLDDLQRQEAKFPFLNYAACYWGYYVRQQSDTSDSLTELALKLLSQEGEHPPCAFQSWYSTKDKHNADKKHTLLLTGLHVAAYFGLIEYIVLLACDIQDWNPTDENKRTPLLFAARKGHEGVVRLLLEQDDVDADSKDIYSKSPLSLAAMKGHESVVRLLLERADVDVNSKGEDGQSPLSLAAMRRHEAVVRLLLERADVDVNSKGEDGQSPLSFAAKWGHEAVVRLLLERADVDVNAKTSFGRWPLTLAAKWGRIAVVRLLLERADVDVDPKDKDYGRCALSWAAFGGHEAVVRLLLKRADVDVNAKDYSGLSPLSFAAMGGGEAVVKLLLERDDVDINTKDYFGLSPLSFAAMEGHEVVVRLLLERADVDADSKDNSSQSPLSLAALKGHESVVRLLLERVDVDADSKDNSSQSPLSLAAREGHESVVRLLLERADMDADSKDSHNNSPLSLAAWNGHESVVRLLLEQADVDVNAKANLGLTPLSLAAEMGHEAIVRLLLERADVDINTKMNQFGWSPLSLATMKGYEAVVKLLLERADVDIDVTAEGICDVSPLEWAAWSGHEAVVQLLHQHIEKTSE